MGLLIAHEGGEIFSEPFGIGVHVGVNAHPESGLDGLKGNVSAVGEGNPQGRFPFPRGIGQ